MFRVIFFVLMMCNMQNVACSQKKINLKNHLIKISTFRFNNEQNDFVISDYDTLIYNNEGLLTEKANYYSYSCVGGICFTLNSKLKYIYSEDFLLQKELVYNGTYFQESWKYEYNRNKQWVKKEYFDFQGNNNDSTMYTREYNEDDLIIRETSFSSILVNVKSDCKNFYYNSDGQLIKEELVEYVWHYSDDDYGSCIGMDSEGLICMVDTYEYLNGNLVKKEIADIAYPDTELKLVYIENYLYNSNLQLERINYAYVRGLEPQIRKTTYDYNENSELICENHYKFDGNLDYYVIYDYALLGN
jgi:hypothetical protein